MEYKVRPASLKDTLRIKSLIRSSSVHSRSRKKKSGDGNRKSRRGLLSRIFAPVYSSGIDWHQFIVAETEDGKIIGCVRIKKHGQIRELATAAIEQAWRGKGVDRAIGRYILEKLPRPLWGTCLNHLAPYYIRFGGMEITNPEQVPSYFRRRQRIFNILLRFLGSRKRLSVLVLR